MSVSDTCSRCERRALDCKRIEVDGRIQFIEIVRLNYDTNVKSEVSIDFSKYNPLSFILHISNLRKYHLLTFKTLLFKVNILTIVPKFALNSRYF